MLSLGSLMSPVVKSEQITVIFARKLTNIPGITNLDGVEMPFEAHNDHDTSK